MFSMMVSLNHHIEEQDKFFTTLAYDLCMILYENDIESLYPFSQGEDSPIGKISYRLKSENHDDILSENIFELLTRHYKDDVNSLLVMDEHLLDFDREWNGVFPTGKAPLF